MQQCYRKGYDNSKVSFYTVKGEGLASLHNNFKKVLGLSEYGFKVEYLTRYVFQFVGIELEGEKYIYINAFDKSAIYNNNLKDWKTKAVKVCDGGHAYWGILFQVTSQSFFELSFNGEG